MATRNTGAGHGKKKSRVTAEQMAQHAGDAATLLRALASEHRLMVLCALVQGERSVSELLEGTSLTQSALSQHLAVLRRERLVTARREGQAVFYSLRPGPAPSLIRVLYDNYCCNPK